MSLKDLFNDAEKARQKAEEAHRRLAEAESKADADRRARETAARQQWLDAWDPRAEGQAVKDAYERLRGELSGAALRDYVTAVLVEERRHRLARKAIDAGATLRAGRTPPASGAHPSAVGGDIYGFINGLLGFIIAEQATAMAEVETAQHHAMVNAAAASADWHEPQAFKIRYPAPGSYTDRVGDVEIAVVDGVAYLPLGQDPRLRRLVQRFETDPNFRVEPVWAVPSAHTDAVRKLRTVYGAPTADAGARGPSGAPVDVGPNTAPARR